MLTYGLSRFPDNPKLASYSRAWVKVGGVKVGYCMCNIDRPPGARCSALRIFDLLTEMIDVCRGDYRMTAADCVCGKTPTFARISVAAYFPERSQTVRVCLPCHAVVGLVIGGD